MKTFWSCSTRITVSRSTSSALIKTDVCERVREVLTVLHGTFQVVQHAVVVHAAEHSFVHQSELLSCRQLAFAGEAGEAGQVVSVTASSPHPVAGVDLAPTAGTLSTKPTVRETRPGASILCCDSLKYRALSRLRHHCSLGKLDFPELKCVGVFIQKLSTPFYPNLITCQFPPTSQPDVILHPTGEGEA